MSDATSFPRPGGALPPADETLAGLGLRLRRAEAGDLPFLRRLYGDLRAEEMALAPWPLAMKAAFLDDQFRLQHLHFVRHFRDADFLVVEHCAPPTAPTPIGRLYLDRSRAVWRIVDIGLAIGRRSSGLGAALMRWIEASARASGAAGVDLHVAQHNPRARRLYENLGYVAAEPAGDPLYMRLALGAGEVS